MENFITGTLTLFGDPTSLLIFVGGLLGGMLFGAIPGVSMLTLAAILLPFSGDMTPSKILTNLIQTGLTESSPCRVLSQEYGQ